MTFIGGPETIKYGGVQSDVEIEIETPSGQRVILIQPIVINRANEWKPFVVLDQSSVDQLVGQLAYDFSDVLSGSWVDEMEINSVLDKRVE